MIFNHMEGDGSWIDEAYGDYEPNRCPQCNKIVQKKGFCSSLCHTANCL